MKKITTLFSFGIFALLLSLLIPVFSSAQTCPLGAVCVGNPLNATSFEAIIDNIIDFIFKIAVVLAPLMVVIGGFLFVTAGGNIQQITQAKNLLIWTAVGSLVVLFSKGILGIIETILGRE